MAEEAGVVEVVVTGLCITEGMLVMTRLEVVTKLEVEVVATVVTVLGEAVWTTGAMPLGLFRPNVEKSKSSGFSLVSPVFSKKVFNSLRDRNLLPLGPMMKTSYRPAEAPLFLWETF